MDLVHSPALPAMIFNYSLIVLIFQKMPIFVQDMIHNFGYYFVEKKQEKEENRKGTATFARNADFR